MGTNSLPGHRRVARLLQAARLGRFTAPPLGCIARNLLQHQHPKWSLHFHYMPHGWILLGEDDTDDVLFIRRAFETAEVNDQLVVAPNGQEVLDCLNREGRFQDRPSGEPSVIILDHRMPVLNGLAVLAKLKEHPVYKHIPVVMYSGAMTRNQIEEAYDLGVSAFVQKPGDFKTFIRIFSCLGLFWTDGNVHPGTFVDR